MDRYVYFNVWNLVEFSVFGFKEKKKVLIVGF